MMEFQNIKVNGKKPIDYNNITSTVPYVNNMPNEIVYVYLTNTKTLSYSSTPNYEKEYIKTCTNLKIIEQKNAIYTLMKMAVKDIYGIDEDFSHYKKTDNGKPYTSNYKFSLSHSDNLCCLVIGNIEVGIDIECESKNRNLELLYQKISSPSDNITELNNHNLIELWTKKEAIFKLLGDRVFVPSKIDTQKYCINTFDNINSDDKKYIVSVATYKPVDIIFRVVD